MLMCRLDRHASHTQHTTALKEHLARAQCKYKHYVDKKRSDRQFTEREMVHLRLQPYTQSSVVNRSCQFFGPFKILSKIGQAAHKMELPRVWCTQFFMSPKHTYLTTLQSSLLFQSHWTCPFLVWYLKRFWIAGWLRKAMQRICRYL